MANSPRKPAETGETPSDVDVAKLRRESPREFDAMVAHYVHGYRCLSIQHRGSEPYHTVWDMSAQVETRFACKGVEVHDVSPGELFADRESDFGNCPHYEKPGEDYATLKLVRETWDVQPFRDYLRALNNIQHGRLNEFMWSRKWGAYPDGSRAEVMYEPGDFSEAALRVALAGGKGKR